MVAVWGSGGKGPSTTLVMVDHEGNMVDMLYCGQLSGSIRQSRAVQENDLSYEEAIRDPHKASPALHMSLRMSAGISLVMLDLL